jgi:hypothetical protein
LNNKVIFGITVRGISEALVGFAIGDLMSVLNIKYGLPKKKMSYPLKMKCSFLLRGSDGATRKSKDFHFL